VEEAEGGVELGGARHGGRGWSWVVVEDTGIAGRSQVVEDPGIDTPIWVEVGLWSVSGSSPAL